MPEKSGLLLDGYTCSHLEKRKWFWWIIFLGSYLSFKIIDLRRINHHPMNLGGSKLPTNLISTIILSWEEFRPIIQ